MGLWDRITGRDASRDQAAADLAAANRLAAAAARCWREGDTVRAAQFEQGATKYRSRAKRAGR